MIPNLPLSLRYRKKWSKINLIKKELYVTQTHITLLLKINNKGKMPIIKFYLTLSTIALNASGLFTARSARTLRLISIPALCRAPINVE